MPPRSCTPAAPNVATWALAAIVAAPGAAAAQVPSPGPGRADRPAQPETRPGAPAPRTVDLADVLARARNSARPAAARAAAVAARAQAQEATRAWWPQLELTAVAGPSPDVRCVPSVDACVATEPRETRIDLDGFFGRVDAQAMLPVFTFGKLAAGRRAARAGARAADALVEVAEGDAVVEAARSYHAVKLGRELVLMLEEGRERVGDELARVEASLDAGRGEVTEADRHRLRTVAAEVDARLSEAREVERLGLAGLRLVFDDESFVVDDAPLEAVRWDLPASHAARRAARARRAETRAAAAGIDAAAGLAALEARRRWPDLVLVARASYARATDADDPRSAFADDPLNVSSITAGVALRWTLDLGVRDARIRRADAEATRAAEVARHARAGVAADAERAWSAARDAADRMAAARRGERAARAWLVATAQSTAAGLAEPEELADALVAWFEMRARLLQATFDWNVGVVALQRATGEHPTGGPRR